MPRVSYKAKLESLRKVRDKIKQGEIYIDSNSKTLGFQSLKKLFRKTVAYFDYNYTYKGITADSQDILIKCVPVQSRYSIKSGDHPNTVEYTYLKELTDNMVLKGVTPHVPMYLGITKIPTTSYPLAKLNLAKLERNGEIRHKVLVLLAEYVNGGDLVKYSSDNNISPYQWKVMMFQIIYTLFALQKIYKFNHNDFHEGNIVIDTTEYSEDYFEYKVPGIGIFYAMNTGIMPKIWDFEFSNAYQSGPTGPILQNKKLFAHDIDVEPPEYYDQCYDIHFLLNNILELDIPDDLRAWIVSLYPSALLNQKYVDAYTDSGTGSEQTYSDSYSDSEYSHSYSSHSGSKSNSDSSSDECTCDSCTGKKFENEYIMHSRMRAGVGAKLGLPTPEALLKHSFFDELKIAPILSSGCIITTFTF